MESGKRSGATAALIAVLFLALAPAAARAATDCLACHGEPEFKDASGHRLYVDAGRQKASVHGSLACNDCHSDITDYPHPKRPRRAECAACHSEEATAVPKSVHSVLGATACTNCHGEPHAVQQGAQAMPQQCGACHAGEVRDYVQSIHAFARKEGDKQGAICSSCHGPVHKILPGGDPGSPTVKKNLPATCGSCHANPEFLASHDIPFARPVEAYRFSVHGRAVANGVAGAPSCSDCHSNHAILPPRDTRSKINHWAVPQTCGACHTQIAKAFADSVHGSAVQRGVTGAPVCTDCHGEHSILAPSEPQSLVSPARVSQVTCGRCHGDERLTQRYNLPLDKVPTFQDSYHGLALRAGSLTVANCASCHGVHNIFPASDPRSTVHPSNLAHTCGRCHAGAGKSFLIGPVHVKTATASEHPVVKWIRIAYWVLIPLTLAFMLLHNGLDLFAKLLRGVSRQAAGEQVARMNLHFRFAHWLVMVSFPMLIFTGFALKFPETWWAQPLLHWESRLALRGTLHRISAVLLCASVLYHIVHLAFSRRDRAILKLLLPGKKDLLDLVGLVRFNLRKAGQRPQFGKFSYAEKIEYWAFIWGFVVMAVSGFLLWFNNFTLHYFPKWAADAATALHYYEAILATLAIVIWHLYLVIFDPEVYPMDRAWLTGKVPASHLKETRPAYYRTLTGKQPREDQPAEDPVSIDAVTPDTPPEAKPR